MKTPQTLRPPGPRFARVTPVLLLSLALLFPAADQALHGGAAALGRYLRRLGPATAAAAESVDAPTGAPTGRLAGRNIALDAGHEQPYESPHHSRYRWLASGRSSFFYDTKLRYPGHPLAIAEGPYRAAIPEHRINQDVVLKLARFLAAQGAEITLTRINRAYPDGRQVTRGESYRAGRAEQIVISAADLAGLAARARQRNPQNQVPIEAIYAATGESADREQRRAALENVLARAELANRARADLALVIHADALNLPDQRGRLVLVYHPGKPEVHDTRRYKPLAGPSLRLAEEIDRALTTLPERWRIPLEGVYGRDLWYLSVAQMPAVAIELGRMTNRQDMDILADDEGRQRMAEAIGQGVVRFLEKRDAAPR